MVEDDKTKPGGPSVVALSEKFMRKVFEGAGEVIDRGLGRDKTFAGAPTVNALIREMKKLIDARIHNDEKLKNVAPHVMKMKVAWGTYSEAPPERMKEIEHEILAAAIDHINDNRYHTLAAVCVELHPDVFSEGISIDPSFGELEEQLKKAEDATTGDHLLSEQEPAAIGIVARALLPAGPRDFALHLKPGGRRFSVGRGADNDICLIDNSVSKIHAALVMNRDEALLVADTGSTNGTFINGERLSYGESKLINDGDLIAFGDIEVRFRRH